MNLPLTATSREEIEVHRFSWLVSIGVPLAALYIQSFLPRYVHFIAVFDLPLLVTVFFAVARRRPIPGMITGALIGSVQDLLAGGDVGLYGIAKTVVGYLASSLGVKLDVENPGSRFLMTSGFYLLHRVIYLLIDLELVGAGEPWKWGDTLMGAVANGLLAVVLFVLLDRLKQRS
jgi:rod shape-determining protein MreD